MREYTEQLQIISQEDSKPKVINYLRLKELLIAIGLITEVSATGDSQERVLLYDFWKALGGEEKEEINILDTTTLIVAVLRMHADRIGVDCSD